MADIERRRQASRRHYQTNRRDYSVRQRQKRQERAKLLRSHKNRPCFDCGEQYPYYVMDFDHRPNEQKLYEPNKLANVSSIRRILAELAKCDVVCSNCHRIRTYERSNCKETANEAAEDTLSH